MKRRGLGSIAVTITGTTVGGHDTGCIGALANPDIAVDPRLDPQPDSSRVVGNLALRSGLNPVPYRPRTPSTPRADLLYDGSYDGNSFGANVFGTDLPTGITAAFSCQP